MNKQVRKMYLLFSLWLSIRSLHSVLMLPCVTRCHKRHHSISFGILIQYPFFFKWHIHKCIINNFCSYHLYKCVCFYFFSSPTCWYILFFFVSPLLFALIATDCAEIDFFLDCGQSKKGSDSAQDLFPPDYFFILQVKKPVLLSFLTFYDIPFRYWPLHTF
jgi:hypothetical protein